MTCFGMKSVFLFGAILVGACGGTTGESVSNANQAVDGAGLVGVGRACKDQPQFGFDPSTACTPDLDCVHHDAPGFPGFCRNVIHPPPPAGQGGLCDTDRDCHSGLICTGGTSHVSSRCEAGARPPPPPPAPDPVGLVDVGGVCTGQVLGNVNPRTSCKPGLFCKCTLLNGGMDGCSQFGTCR